MLFLYAIMIAPFAEQPAPARHGHPGRPRAFDPRKALAEALDLFWLQGYAATSIDDLTAAMNISRSSFYSAFTSKHAILLAAVESYIDTFQTRLETEAAAAATPREAVRAIIDTIADADGDRRGCFLVNCITELAPHDAALADLSRGQLSRIQSLIETTLRQSGMAADLAPLRAAGLTTIAAGATLLRKAGLPPATIRTVMDQAEALFPARG